MSLGMRQAAIGASPTVSVLCALDELPGDSLVFVWRHHVVLSDRSSRAGSPYDFPDATLWALLTRLRGHDDLLSVVEAVLPPQPELQPRKIHFTCISLCCAKWSKK